MIRSIIAAFLLCLPAPVLGLDFYEERGGWSIAPSDDGCAMSMDYDGDGQTTVLFGKDIDGSLFISVTNYNWSAKRGTTYDITYSLNGKLYGGGKNPGIESSGQKGFVSRVENSFERDFAAGRSLQIYLGEQLIDRLSLSGTAVGVASLNRCVTLLKQEHAAEAKEKAKYADLPNDPFSKATTSSGTAGGTDPTPKQNMGIWVTSNDYPAKAIREKHEGTTRFRLFIDTHGAVQKCETIETSGFPELDEQTCALALRRARFDPARDSSGKNIEGVWESAVRWELPTSLPPRPAPTNCVVGEVCIR
ncbi:MAG: energy transducer TonB [Tsuneonella suprasediminis]|nr:energy transducer TonB [Tsuneonella suprasediminis]UBS32901.1 energy transducer TonB [Altererythrobacter sp. N1]